MSLRESRPCPPSTFEQAVCVVEEQIHQLDAALGRPPFPNPSPENARGIAAEVLRSLEDIQRRNRLQALSNSEPVTTTLPILCASLCEGSVNRQPCLQLYELLLSALTVVCRFSSYPIQIILKDAEGILPPQSVVLFRLTAAAGALTPQRMGPFLGVMSCSAAPKQPKKERGRKARRSGHETITSSAGDNPMESTKGCHKDSVVAGHTRDAWRGPSPSRDLLLAMLETPLDISCRAVLATLFDSTDKFLKIVQDDGVVAAAILGIYGAVVLPRLEVAALLPCLDEHLLDYLVDILQEAPPCEGKVNGEWGLGGQHEPPAVPPIAWTPEHVGHLCNALSSRVVSKSDAYGSALASDLFLGVLLERKGDFVDTLGKHAFGSCLHSLWSASLTSALCKARHISERAPQLTSDARGLLHVDMDHEAVLWLSVWSRSACQSLDEALPYSLCPSEDNLLALDPGLLAQIRRYKREVLYPLLKTTPPSSPDTSGSAQHTAPKRKHAKKDKPGQAVVRFEALKNERRGDGEGCVAHTRLTFSSFACMSMNVVLFVEALAASSGATLASVEVLCDLLHYAHRHQRLVMGKVLSGKLLDLFCLLGWQRIYENSLQEAGFASFFSSLRVQGVLATASLTTSNARWATPYLLYAAEDTQERAWVQEKWTAALWAALVSATLAHHSNGKRTHGKEENEADTQEKVLSNRDGRGLLYPSLYNRADAVLGLVGHLIPDGFLNQDTTLLGESLPTATLLSYLEEALPRLEVETATSESAGSCPDSAATGHRRSTHLRVCGLRRLLGVMDAWQQRNMQKWQTEKETLSSARRAHLLQQVEEASRLASARESFEREQQAKMATHQKEVERVREEYVRRRAAQEQRRLQEEREMALKRRLARTLLRERETKTREERLRESAERFKQYKKRLAGTFRVSLFLEHLQLSSLRIMEVMNALRSVAVHINPDELLEFLVTGNAQVPVDMLLEHCGSVDMSLGGVDVGTDPHDPAGSLVVQDFWTDVLRGPTPQPQAGARDADVISSTAVGHSFHYCVKSLLDLFCYEGGNEFGDLPIPMPTVHIRLASKFYRPQELHRCGFRDVTSAFCTLRERGLVTLSNGVAQLTVLGFRYHFPFHSAGGMLEVRICESRERIRALAMDRLVEWSGEESGEVSEPEEGRLLPEVVFGI